MKIHAPVIALVLALASGASAETDDGAVAIHEDFAHVAPAQGPAWWKVSKGGSIGWLMGLPPSRSLGNVAWDKATYRRRLARARMFIAPYGEPTNLAQDDVWPDLPPILADDARSILIRLKFEQRRDALKELGAALMARSVFAAQFPQIVEEAKRERVPFVRG